MGIGALRAAVLLDRDGVLNRAYPDGASTRPPRSLGELELLPGVLGALGRLRAANFVLVGVSNQPDLRRGLTTSATVAEINARISDLCGLSEILVCPHDSSDGCDCRKPKPGLLLEAAKRHAIDLPRSYLVGDRWSDVAAGQAAGCYSILVDGPDAQPERCRPDARARDLAQATDLILAHTPGC